MKSSNKKKINFAMLMLFPVIMLIYLIVCNIYNFNLNNSITRELNTFTNSLYSNIENRYMEMVSLYFGEQLQDYNKANEITNLVKEQVRLGITPNFSTLKFSITRLLGNSLLSITYIALFLLILMFALILFIGYTNNSLTGNTAAVLENNVKKETPAPPPIITKKEEIIMPPPDIEGILRKQGEKKQKEIENLYQDLISEIKNARDERALEILEKIFSLDEKSYLALNGAGILYTKMYSRNNKNIYFMKADKYYDSAISIYDNKDILNNKAVLYSTRYGAEKSDYDYNTALTIYDNMIYSNDKSDFILLNNRATIYLTKYNITGNEELFENSLKDYEKIIEADGGNIYALNNRSALYFDKYKKTNDNQYFNKSIEDCNSAFKIDANEALKNNEGPTYIYKY